MLKYTPSNFTEYLTFVMFLAIAMTITLIILGMSMVISDNQENLEKLSAYECGFDLVPSMTNYVYTVFLTIKK